jgi:hypothetical protein
MARWSSWLREPGYIEYQRRRGGDPVLEPVGQMRMAEEHEFIIVCGIGSRIVFIRWYGWNIEDTRQTFTQWLQEPWRKLTTDIYGNAMPNGYDFKTSRVDWFNVAGEDEEDRFGGAAGSATPFRRVLGA